MDLYDKLERNIKKAEILEYEKIIERINEYYNGYRVSNGEILTLDTKVDYCLLNGELGFRYYLADYMKSENADPEFLSFVESIDPEKEQQYYGTEEINSRVMKRMIQKNNLNAGNERISYEEQIEILRNNVDNVNEQKDNLLFLTMAANLSEKHDRIYNYIQNKAKMRTSETKQLIESMTEVMDEEKISIDRNEILSIILDEHKKREVIRQQIRSHLEEKIPINTFFAITNKLRNYVAKEIADGKDKDEVLKEVLPEAYGVVKAACEYVLKKTPYDVQLMGAIALNDGKVSEMYTGEGKTMTAILPAYLNALTGKEVDIYTPNDYLAQRDYLETKKVFEILDLTVGCVKYKDQSDEEKKKQYKCDVVYGSSTAFAFDYLKDINASDEDMVGRGEKPGFAIVDEADQVLINNARTPYQLTKSSKSDTLEKRKTDEKILSSLKAGIAIQKELSKSTVKVNSDDVFDSFINNEDRTKMYDLYNEQYSLIVGPKKVHVTNKGEREIFYHYMYDEIFDLSNKAKEFFVESEKYVDGVDYVSSADNIVLTPIGAEKASFEISDFQDLRMKWLTDPECIDVIHYINNALTAEYSMVKGQEYQVVTNPQTNKKEIVVLQDGRILKDSKFQYGLHEAIALKEGLDPVADREESLTQDMLATISNRALLSRYSKFSGMTGTADKTAFYDIYKLDTFEVPKNKEYQYKKGLIFSAPEKRVDHPTKLYETQEQKINAIIEDIKSSQSKKQPILVVTNNDEIAKEIHEKLRSEFGLKADLLISSKDLEEEAKIISKAGMPGAITISSEMAGRGTDIKLGGNFDDVKKGIRDSILLQQAISAKYEEEKTGDKKQFIDAAFSMICKNPQLAKELISELKTKYKNDSTYREEIDLLVKQSYERGKDRIKASGGIKYLQINPFMTSRNDNQGRGRVARQGDPGETVMYASFEDLKEIGVSEDDVNGLKEQMSGKEYLDDSMCNDKVSEVIEKAQTNNEYEYNLQIASTDTTDYAMTSLGISMLNYKKKANSLENPNVQFDKIIDLVIENVITDSVPKNKKRKVSNDEYKLSRLKINKKALSTELKKTFGLTIETEDIKSMDYVGELKDYIFDKAKELQGLNNTGKSEDRIKNDIRSSITKSINNMYNSFVQSADTVRLQAMNDRLANNNSHDRTKELDIIYNECVKDGWKSCVKKVFLPYVKEKEEKNVIVGEEEYIDNLPTVEEVSKKK